MLSEPFLERLRTCDLFPFAAVAVQKYPRCSISTIAPFPPFKYPEKVTDNAVRNCATLFPYAEYQSVLLCKTHTERKIQSAENHSFLLEKRKAAASGKKDRIGRTVQTDPEKGRQAHENQISGLYRRKSRRKNPRSAESTEQKQNTKSIGKMITHLTNAVTPEPYCFVPVIFAGRILLRIDRKGGMYTSSLYAQ